MLSQIILGTPIFGICKCIHTVNSKQKIIKGTNMNPYLGRYRFNKEWLTCEIRTPIDWALNVPESQRLAHIPRLSPAHINFWNWFYFLRTERRSVSFNLACGIGKLCIPRVCKQRHGDSMNCWATGKRTLVDDGWTWHEEEKYLRLKK